MKVNFEAADWSTYVDIWAALMVCNTRSLPENPKMEFEVISRYIRKLNIPWSNVDLLIRIALGAKKNGYSPIRWSKEVSERCVREFREMDLLIEEENLKEILILACFMYNKYLILTHRYGESIAKEISNIIFQDLEEDQRSLGYLDNCKGKTNANNE